MDNFLDQQSQKFPKVAAHYQRLGNLYRGKLWHQFTEELAQCVLEEDFITAGPTNLIDFYNEFLSKFENKLNQLRFVQIASVISRQFIRSKSPVVKEEVLEAISFMEAISAKKARLGEEAYLVSQMAIAEFLVSLGTPEELKQAKVLLDETQPELVLLEGSGAETFVNSSFYRVNCAYYKVVGPADEFYRSCIQFLAYTPVDTLKEEVQRQLSIDMALAALTGETVFNFGEVLAQPIIKVLIGTEFEWLHRMMVVFSSGDIDEFSSLCNNNSQAVNSQPILTQNFELLKQKLALLKLMQIVFDRPTEDRIMPLKDIAYYTKLETSQVEWLLIKAISKGLIKGKIDQVEEVVNITWLKPRVLDKPQLSTLTDKLKVWSDRVGDTQLFMEKESPQLFHVSS